MRKPFLDNIRWAAVLLVLAYHICYLFNGVGILGAVPGAKSVPALDAFAAFVYPWFMVLLFTIAGISARYALERRGAREFLRERRDKLLVPSTLGLFVVHWLTGYLNIKMGGALELIPGFLRYPISVISGIGPLWFAQMLFLYSCLLAAVWKTGWVERLRRRCEGTDTAAVFLLFLPLWGASQVLNMPVLTMYRFGIYLFSFFTGYFLLSHEPVQIALERFCLPLLLLAAVSGAVYTVRWLEKDFTAQACLRSLLTNFYAWTATLAVLGCGRRYVNWETAFARYMCRTSFGVYVLHYPVLLTICYGLHTCRCFPPAGNYLLALAAGLPATFALYELICRVPVIRYFVLGRRGR